MQVNTINYITILAPSQVTQILIFQINFKNIQNSFLLFFFIHCMNASSALFEQRKVLLDSILHWGVLHSNDMEKRYWEICFSNYFVFFSFNFKFKIPFRAGIIKMWEDRSVVVHEFWWIIISDIFDKLKLVQGRISAEPFNATKFVLCKEFQ